MESGEEGDAQKNKTRKTLTLKDSPVHLAVFIQLHQHAVTIWNEDAAACTLYKASIYSRRQ